MGVGLRSIQASSPVCTWCSQHAPCRLAHLSAQWAQVRSHVGERCWDGDCPAPTLGSLPVVILHRVCDVGSPVPRPPSSVRVSPGHSHAQPPAHGGQDSTQRPVLCPIVASFCLSQSGHSCEAASLPSSTLLSLGLRTRSFCQQQEHSPVRGRSCGCGGPGRGPWAGRDRGGDDGSHRSPVSSGLRNPCRQPGVVGPTVPEHWESLLSSWAGRPVVCSQGYCTGTGLLCQAFPAPPM